MFTITPSFMLTHSCLMFNLILTIYLLLCTSTHQALFYQYRQHILCYRMVTGFWSAIYPSWCMSMWYQSYQFGWVWQNLRHQNQIYGNFDVTCFLGILIISSINGYHITSESGSRKSVWNSLNSGFWSFSHTYSSRCLSSNTCKWRTKIRFWYWRFY